MIPNDIHGFAVDYNNMMMNINLWIEMNLIT